MNSIDALPSTTFSGRRFTREQLARVQETIAMFSGLSRKELAQTVCEHLNWKNARGANMTDSCLKMLETLQEHGVITLPEKRQSNCAPKHAVKNLELAEQGLAIEGSLEEIGPIVLERIVTPEQRAAFKASIQVHHYLGYRHQVGSQLGYFIVSQRNGQRLGCLLFSTSSAWHLPARDLWIGWEKKHREKFRHLILSQDRFLIFPWVNVPHLASHVLAICEKQVASDWVEVYGYRPALMETFVDSTRFPGTCYRAANWQCVGQTESRRKYDPKNPEVKGDFKTVKDIFVRPLTNDVHRALTEGYQERPAKRRYRNDVKASKTRSVDEDFVALWKKVIGLLHEVAAIYDKRWRVRDRVLDTLLLMLLVFRLVTSKNKQSYGTTIDELWDTCRELELPLPQKTSVAPSSLCAARKKLDENAFKSLNQKILETYAQHNSDRFLWNGRRVFAVDGSKLNLPRALLDVGYALPANDAHYPQGLLSCLYELRSQLPIDFDLVSHCDERRCAEQHLRAVKRNDVVVYDRGYFSYVLLHHHFQTGVQAVFRLQESSTSDINNFWNSPDVDKIVTIYPSRCTIAEIAKKHPDIHIIPRTLRLVKYQINGMTYCLGTTLVEETISLQALIDLYYARWGLEELYKVSKRIFVIEDFHAKHERGVKQELFAHFVLITLNRLFANHTDQDLNSASEVDGSSRLPLPMLDASPSSVRRIKTNFKNCIAVIARHLEPLLFFHKKLVHAVDTAYAFIIKQHQRVRPNRSYPRKSMRPSSKWHPSNKNGKPRFAPVQTAA